MSPHMAGSGRPVVDGDLASFTEHLRSSNRILALLGAGLSASSGLPTFRGAGGLWRTHDAMSLATPEAFDRDPGLVWQFYSHRRHMALRAQPNRAHFALAELAKRKDGFMTLSQNVDGLSQRAGHPQDRLQLLHGNLFDTRCTNFYCDFQEINHDDPIAPSLAIPHSGKDPTTPSPYHESRPANPPDSSLGLSVADDVTMPLPSIPSDQLPHCPKCTRGLLRPGVVWFGEMLPSKVIDAVDDFLVSSPTVDLILVIGTSARVYPAAGYVDRARAKGARVAVVNVEADDRPAAGLVEGDWFFRGDAAEIVPEILREVVGDIP